jgi:hypothetical protein
LPLLAERGVQTPRILTRPERLTSAGADAVDLARTAGLELDPWQELVLEEALGERADGKWAAKQVGLIVPRQNGKGAILEALELAALFLFGMKLIMHSAHEFKTAGEAFRRIRGLIENTPELHSQVASYRVSNGKEGIELKNGSRLQFVARSGGSGRGFTGDLVVFDEAYDLPPKVLDALIPTLSARMSMTESGPQFWFTSSAPLPDSDVLRRLRRRGTKGEPDLCYLEWSAPEDADLEDPDMLAMANPALGYRVDAEFVEIERAALTLEGFARERFGIAPDLDERSLVIPYDRWVACEDALSRFVGDPVVAVDVTPDRGRATIAAAGLRDDGLPHIEVIQNDVGTGWVIPRLQSLLTRPRRILVIGPDPAGSLIAEGANVGLEIEAITTADHSKACGLLYDLAVQGRMRHGPDPLLEKALAGAVKADIGDGSWRWSRKNSLVDISPLVACTLALWAATDEPPTDVSFEWL